MTFNTPTKQTTALTEALRVRGIRVETEYWDGHKHIDVYLPDARIFVEVDGLQHYTNPKQILADFKRDHFSDGDDVPTLRLTNQLIETHLEEIADAITKIASLDSKN